MKTEISEFEKNSVAMPEYGPYISDGVPRRIVFETPSVDPKPSALESQVGGGHYKSKGIQPWEYITANSLGFFEGNVVKYVTRYKDKSGVEDLKKARHYLDYLIELEESKND